MPASNTKILTAVTALHVLGPGLPLLHRGDPARPGHRRRAERPALPQGLRRPDDPPVGLRLARPAGEGRGDHPGHRAGSSPTAASSTASATTRAGPPRYASRLLRGRDRRAHRRPERRLRHRHGDRQVRGRRQGPQGQDQHHAGRGGEVRQDRQQDHHRGPRAARSRSRPGARGSNTITVSGPGAAAGAAAAPWCTVDKPELYAAAVFRAELAKVGDHRGRVEHQIGATPRRRSAPGRPATPRCRCRSCSCRS